MVPGEIVADKLYSLGEVRALLPAFRNGRPVALSTLWRWRRNGQLGSTTMRVGGRLVPLVKGSDILRLLEMPAEAVARPRSRAEVRTSHNRAAAELKRKYGLSCPEL